MTLANGIELANTQAKLRILEERYESLGRQDGGDMELRSATMDSYKRLINQLTEEIAIYNAHHHPKHASTSTK